MSDLENRLLLLKKIQVGKDIKNHVGCWVALDDRDRIIAYGKKKAEVWGKAVNFRGNDKLADFKLYKLYDPYIRTILMGLLDYQDSI